MGWAVNEKSTFFTCTMFVPTNSTAPEALSLARADVGPRSAHFTSGMSSWCGCRWQRWRSGRGSGRRSRRGAGVLDLGLSLVRLVRRDDLAA
jgi:hypothetical protein